MNKKIVAALCLTLLPGIAFSDNHGGSGDAENGKKIFRKCKACHAVGEGAENKVGPQLNGIIDRQIGALDGFSYSAVLADMGAEGKTWTVEELAAFLEKPRSYAKGTKMSFAGLRKEEERADIIAYLATFPAE